MKHLLTSHDVVSILCQIKRNENIYGSQHPENIALLVDVAKQLPDKAVCVEIGTRWGYSALAFLLGNLNLKLTTIDTEDCSGGVRETIKELEDNKDYRVPYYPAEWKLSERLTFVRGDSVEIAKKWTDKVDYLFIDGDHAYEGVKRDILAWLPHLDKGGSMIGFHDFQHPDNDNMKVTKVVYEHFLDNPLNWRIYKANYQMIFFQNKKDI